jgi:3-phenylpropionate/trans-cinnamate dioxygenase ferredoxin subunit
MNCERAQRKDDVMPQNWIKVCDENDLEEESVAAFDHDGTTYAVFRSPEGSYHVTDGHCTHEPRHLAKGLVLGDEVECSAHCGRFNYKTGQALQIPAKTDLRTWPVKIADGAVWLDIGGH